MDDDDGPTDRMTLKLEPLCEGAYTQLSLTGPMATVPRGKELRRLLALLALWHGGPIEVVLCVGLETAGWLEIWNEALCAVPMRQHHVRFVIERGDGVGGGAHG